MPAVLVPILRRDTFNQDICLPLVTQQRRPGVRRLLTVGHRDVVSVRSGWPGAATKRGRLASSY